jgi:glutamyl-tRNA synthetase
MNKNTDQLVRVRFAPSPTGQLHLGGARTALFNWLFAQSNNGIFLLRIEDTDKVRSRQKFVDQICESLNWMGCRWDEDLKFQSQRDELYERKLQVLLESGNAYRCFCDKEVLANIRSEREKAGMGYSYPGKCRSLNNNDIKVKLESNVPNVIRIKIPEGTTKFSDSIYGDISVNNDELDDFIVARTDGSPTYNFTVVADDNDMDITHVIRGEDHISNTPKQIILYEALGYDIPQFAHLPMILGEDKKRLSKRHGATGVQEFRDKGFLNSALVNYLALLGWNPGTEQELFSPGELTREFSIDRVHKKGAVWDNQKLEWINQQTILRMKNDDILVQILNIDSQWGEKQQEETLLSVIELMKPRSKTFVEFIDTTDYFFNDPKEYDQKTIRKRWNNFDVNELVNEYIQCLDSVEEWTVENVEDELRNLSDRKNISPAKLIHPVRLALSGTGTGPSLFHMMKVLGKDISVRRLKKAVDSLPIEKQ